MSTKYQLVMRSGPNPGATFSLDTDMTTIGRDPSNSISVNDPEISRQHAKLMQQGGKIVIQDNGSTNGTLVNGNRIPGPHVLKSGEMISFGEEIVFLFEAITFDPDATVVSSSASQQPSAVPRQKPIAPTSPPPQAYAGQVPAGPAPVAPPPPSPSQTGKRIALPVAIGAGGLALICVCGGFFWWVDAANKWCDIFPFFFGSACG